MKIPNSIEEIYPLTIIMTRCGGNIVIFNNECDNQGGIISDIQLENEFSHDEKSIDEIYHSGAFGFGKTVVDAFVNYQNRLRK